MTDVAIKKDNFLSKITKNNNDVKKEANSTENISESNKNLFEVKSKGNNSKSFDISLEEYSNATDSAIDLEAIPHSAVQPMELDSINYDYKDSGTKNGIIEYSKQRKTGDCWLLSGINAMSYCKKGQDIIKNALEYHDGYTTVHTMAGDYNVTDEELGIVRTLDVVHNQYSSGDDDMLILELAIEKIYDDAANNNFIIDYSKFDLMSALRGRKATTPLNSSLNGGWSSIAMYLLSGNTCKIAQDKNEENQFLNEFAKDKSQNIAMTTSFKENVQVKDAEGKTIKLISNHEYAIKKVTKDTVTVVNPYDSSKEIIIPRDTFLDNSINMEKTDFSDESSKKNLIYYPSEQKEETIGDTKYNVITYTDDNGKLLSKAYKAADCKHDSGIICNYDENGEITGGSVGVYSREGLNSISDLSKEDIKLIFDRKLLSYHNQFDLINDIPNYLTKISDEKWNVIKNYIESPITAERFEGSDLFNLSQLSEEDFNTADKLFKKFPNAKVYNIINYANSENINTNVLYLAYHTVNSYSIIDGITPEHLKGDSDDSLKGCLKKIYYNFSQEEAAKIYKNIIERQLIPNLNLNRELSANDIYYLSQIDDKHWSEAIERLNSDPYCTCEEIYNFFRY